MATLVGKVGIVLKGEWNSSATYEELDAVSYNSGFYIAKQNVPANTLPTENTYWQVAIARNKTNIPETRVNFTSSTSFAYTGASVTIPKRCNYSICAGAVYVNSAPQGIAISASDTVLAPHTLFFSGEIANGSISGRTGDSPITFYIWAKYNNATPNYVTYAGWYES